MKKWKSCLITVMLALIGLLSFLELTGAICPPELRAPREGVPTVVTRQDDLLITGISQIASDEDRIYVLYGTYSVVQAYNQAGAYLYSVSVYNHANGLTRVAAQDGNLYIRDKQGNVYIFSGTELIEYLEKPEADHPAAKLPYGVSDPGYRLRWGSVENAEGDTVIARPFYTALYHNGMISRVQFYLIVGIGLILAWGKLGGEKKQ